MKRKKRKKMKAKEEKKKEEEEEEEEKIKQRWTLILILQLLGWFSTWKKTRVFFDHSVPTVVIYDEKFVDSLLADDVYAI
jgi:hypothetical protein